MRSPQILLLAAALSPFAARACTNPDSDACASAFANNLAAASSFCHTFTAAAVTATTGLAAPFAAACSSKTSKLSAECACYVTGSAATSTSTVKVIYIYICVPRK